MSNTPTQPASNGLIPTAESVWIKLLGPNYKIRRLAILRGLNEAIFYLSIIPYDVGPISTLIPYWLKPTLISVCGGAKLIMLVASWFKTKQKDVTGGNIVQDPSGNAVGKQVEG